MRVIAGSARSLPLKTVEGMDTRPTTDRIKETLFNMLQNDVPGARFLDLFSGSGAIGIEALSRGADFAVFVEKNRQALNCIEENLKFTKLDQKARVMGNECLHALRSLEMKKEPFQIIFMDPPYDQDLERSVLEYLSHSVLADEDTLMIVEASLDTDFSYLEGMGLALVKQKKYKTNQHVFIRRK
jgi:16S rRNA (guanine966-N2)-methyltransferase